MRATPAAHATTRSRLAVAACLVLVVALGACSNGGSKGTASLNKGLQALVANDLETAKADFEAVIKVDPKNKYAYYNLGLIHQRQGDNNAAAQQYQLTLTIDPKYDPALYNLGVIRTIAGDTAGAIDLYRQAIASNKNDAKAHFNLGIVLRKTGNPKEGNTQVQAAVKLDPSLAASARSQGVPLG